MKRIAIITGASSGIGKEYALLVEKYFALDEVWLIARRLDRLQEIAPKLSKSHGICLAIDLSQEQDRTQLREKIRAESPQIIVLINNAGFGKFGNFQDLQIQGQLEAIDLNVRALTEISHFCLPYMQAGSALVQVASSIGFLPSPRFAIYAATKAFVVSFSYALAWELKPKGIRVIVVCPGAVATEFLGIAQSEMASNERRHPRHSYFRANARSVAEQTFLDLEAGKIISVYGWYIKLFLILVKLLPLSWATRLAKLR